MRHCSNAEVNSLSYHQEEIWRIVRGSHRSHRKWITNRAFSRASSQPRSAEDEIRLLLPNVRSVSLGTGQTTGLTAKKAHLYEYSHEQDGRRKVIRSDRDDQIDKGIWVLSAKVARIKLCNLQRPQHLALLGISQLFQNHLSTSSVWV